MSKRKNLLIIVSLILIIVLVFGAGLLYRNWSSRKALQAIDLNQVLDSTQTATPVATAVIEETAAPEPTAEPVPSAEPEITAEPEVTAKPEVTAEPEQEAKAAQTAEPVQTASEEPATETDLAADTDLATGTDLEHPLGFVIVYLNDGYIPLPVNGTDYTYPIIQKLAGTEDDENAETYENIIHVLPNGVCIESSNCDNQDCVGEGTITFENKDTRILMNMIVCLPHQVYLELYTYDEMVEMLNQAQQQQQ